MELKRLVTEEQAVSPVIAVILMVAITVILAAVVGSSVLGIGSSQRFNAQPQADFGWETSKMDDGNTSNDELTITHQAGETIRTERLTVLVASDEIYDSGSPDGPGNTILTGWSVDSISAGSQLLYKENDNEEFEEGDSARIIWTGPEGENTATISKSTL